MGIMRSLRIGNLASVFRVSWFIIVFGVCALRGVGMFRLSRVKSLMKTYNERDARCFCGALLVMCLYS
jgi:hypothetical protein